MRVLKGFTLVELLLVVGLISILSAVVLSVMDTNVQRQKTEDTVKANKLKEFSESILTYFYAENSLPTSIDFATNPILSTYLQNWDNNYIYTYFAPSDFSIQITKSQIENGQVQYLKFSTLWGTVKTCGPSTTTAYDSCEE